jgi:hypothetical protein
MIIEASIESGVQLGMPLFREYAEQKHRKASFATWGGGKVCLKESKRSKIVDTTGWGIQGTAKGLGIGLSIVIYLRRRGYEFRSVKNSKDRDLVVSCVCLVSLQP